MADIPDANPADLDSILGFEAPALPATSGEGTPGTIPLTERMLLEEPSGNLFALTQNVGMGWQPARSGGPAYLLLSTHGGLRAEDGSPVALGYHTGHWEVHLLVRAAAEALAADGCIPFAAHVTDPCDGRTQGTPGMMDSLPYRNDAAIVMRRLARSLPTRQGVIGVASCDKGLPAMLLALAGERALPGVVIPGGVTLPARDAEDLGTVQTIGARFAHGLITLDEAATAGCKACGSAGGGCQFLGTAATAQVVAEGLGLALPHTALAPSGQPIWLDMGRRAAAAVVAQRAAGRSMADILDRRAVDNAMVVHAAFGGSTNLLLHIPAIAHAAGLPVPTVADWSRVNRATPRLVDALPNGPANHPTVRVFIAGGVPEVMLHLRRAGLIDPATLTAAGVTWGEALDRWQDSPRRHQLRRHCLDEDGVDPDLVIMDPDTARRRGLTSTVVFPTGSLAPDGSVIKATAIDPGVVDADGVYRHRGPVRLFGSESAAVAAIKGKGERPVQAGDVVVVAGIGPAGTGMEEIYQVTSALKFIPWGKQVAVLTDGRFSGVSTGACVGHIGPEALAGGPIGRLRDGDTVEIVVDRGELTVDQAGQGHAGVVGIDHQPVAAASQPHSLQDRRRRPAGPGVAFDEVEVFGRIGARQVQTLPHRLGMAEDVVGQRRRGGHAHAREAPAQVQVERRQRQTAQAAAGHRHHPHRAADRGGLELAGKLQAGAGKADDAGQLREQLVVHHVRRSAGAPQPFGHAARQLHVALRFLVVQQVHGRAEQMVDQAVALHRPARRVAQEDVVAKAGAHAGGGSQPRVVGVVAHDVDDGVGAGAPHLRHEQLHVAHLVAAEGQSGQVLALDQHRAAQLPAQARRRLQRGGVGAERQPRKAVQPRAQLVRSHGLCEEPDEVLASLADVDDLNTSRILLGSGGVAVP